MRKIILLLLATVLLIAGLASCAAPTQPLVLLGDAEPFLFTARSYDLADAIDARAEQFSLLAIAHDGFAVQLRDGLDNVQLRYRNGWELYAPQHPPSANIRDIAQLIVLSEGDDPYTVRLIDAEGNVQETTAGQLFMHPPQRALRRIGTSWIDYHRASVFHAEYRVPLSELLPESRRAAIFRRCGAVTFDTMAGRYLLIERNQIDLIAPHARIFDIPDIVGIMADSPILQITQLFHDAMRFIEQEQPVLAIKIDGLGWEMLEYAPFIRSLNPQRALTVWPPITPTGLASMLTGETANVHGIARRGQRDLLVDDIFTLVPNSVHIGARNSFINTSLPPQLTTSDADAFMLAQQAIAEPADFTFVHFKQVDSTAHYHGPHAAQTQQAIAEIDDFVRMLAEQFGGRMIITSDHGLHNTADGGNHGLFLPQDMLVPYAVR
ncbi:MAG: alkaline phosphatase family protein [Oscillospiraceae bacterium]|nr:alkaline phosphatase family protein [Oscillospiraceae bacterium]